MNVINDSWIPVIREDGTKEKIRPYQITTHPLNPIITLDCGRPDFNAYAVRFLIGLYNTYMTPKSKKQWKELFTNPPKHSSISNKFRPKHFSLDGRSNRFLQDNKPEELKKTVNIGSLLFDTPGEKTIKDGKDFFQKKTKHVLCQTCATIALYLKQSSAIMAGAGYRTSITSGANGSLTTFITMDTLWETVWSNVIVKKAMDDLGGDSKGTILPWLEGTTDSRDKSTVSLEDKHPYYPLWEMPLRIRIIFEESHKTCTVCGENSPFMACNYKTTNYGNSYTNLRHLFSSFITPSKGKEINFRKPIPNVAYPDQITYLLPTEKTSPAHVVDHFIINKDFLQKEIFDLWTFGYYTDKAKLYGWEEHKFPLSDLLFKDKEFTVKISQLSYLVGWYINNHIRQMWNIERGDPLILNEFFRDTEEDFYRVLKDKNTEVWLKSVVIKGINLFEKHVGKDRIGLQRYLNEQYINTINTKIVKPLEIEPLDYSDFIHLEYQKLNLPYLEKEFLTFFLSWYGHIITSKSKYTFTAISSIDILINDDTFIEFIDNASQYYPDLTTEPTKDIFAAALLIAFNAKNLDFSQTFPAQLVTNNIPDTLLYIISEYERGDLVNKWEAFANIVAKLDGFNITSFLNGFMHWNEDIKAYWKKEYLKYS